MYNSPSLYTYFYPRSPCGERLVSGGTPGQLLAFLSTLSLRRATLFCIISQYLYNKFLSTLSLRRATYTYQKEHHISNISIHALLAESDFRAVTVPDNGLAFLSTLSLRRATPSPDAQLKKLHNFYPRSPCGERQNSQGLLALFTQFLSTLSLRRATKSRVFFAAFAAISIHALLAESDFSRTAFKTFSKIFLSTLSLRRATNPEKRCKRTTVFLSTLSLRRATF